MITKIVILLVSIVEYYRLYEKLGRKDLNDIVKGFRKNWIYTVLMTILLPLVVFWHLMIIFILMKK